MIIHNNWNKALDKADAKSSIMQDLFSINSEQSTAWLGDHRILFINTDLFIELRNKLIKLIGITKTKQTFFDIGYSSGCADGILAMKHGHDLSILEIIEAGRILHSFQGSVAVEPLIVDIDTDTYRCYIEFIWKNSIHYETKNHGDSGEQSHSSCWMETGYASGFLSECIGKPVIVREVQCVSHGSLFCRCIARFKDEWNDNLNVKLDKAPEKIIEKINAMEKTQIIGKTPIINALKQQIKSVANSNATVFLKGESGVGKSMIASEIHRLSPLSESPFVEVNCASIPEALFESEVFGANKGAYTGAQNDRAGKIEDAFGGTLFFDEIDSLSFSSQAKLLRVLQSKTFERLGSNKTITANVRIIVATNTDLEKSISDGAFRKDLFYRLNVFPLDIPPLRERVDDIPILINFITNNICKKHGKKTVTWAPQAVHNLMNYEWPGNIRELENIIERTIILAQDKKLINLAELIMADKVFSKEQNYFPSNIDNSLSGINDSASTINDEWAKTALSKNNITLLDIEKEIILTAIEEHNGNIAKTAKKLGLTRTQLDYRLKKWRTSEVLD